MAGLLNVNVFVAELYMTKDGRADIIDIDVNEGFVSDNV